MKFVKNKILTGKKYGSRYFYLGMYLRIALSLLIDGDWTDTACFFQNIPLSKRISQEETQEIWQKCIYNFEQYLKNEIQNNPDNGNRLNSFRQEISDSCRKAAETNQKLYRLTVPTGAGKTLSSLRFALYHARKEQKNTYYLYSSLHIYFGTERRGNSKSNGIALCCIGTSL